MLNQVSYKPKRGQANRRERVRTENVNAGFDKLRKLIPTEPEDRKLSKIEILRLATSYIQHLYNLTRASSCLEADEICAKEQAKGCEEEKCEKLDTRVTPHVRRTRNHVCTFCLMMSKVQVQLQQQQKQQQGGQVAINTATKQRLPVARAEEKVAP